MEKSRIRDKHPGSATLAKAIDEVKKNSIGETFVKQLQRDIWFNSNLLLKKLPYYLVCKVQGKFFYVRATVPLILQFLFLFSNAEKVKSLIATWKSE
jgi:hypothetical protein